MKKKTRLPVSWTDFSSLRWSGVDRPESRFGKVRLEQFLSDAGFSRLKTLEIFPSASDINFKKLPDFFVLKPTSLWSGKGVMLLHKIAGLDIYFDFMGKKFFQEKDVIEEAQKIEKELDKKLSYMAEQRALDEDPRVPIPFDYKVFSFYGENKFILQVDRNHEVPKIAFFDGEFNPIIDDRVYIPKKRREQTETAHRVPKHAAEILNIASQITTQLNAPFISVDCFSTQNGAMVGELTHTPGGPWFGSMYRFSNEFDKELGDAWWKASKALNIDVPKIEVPYQIKLRGKLIRVVEN